MAGASRRPCPPSTLRRREAAPSGSGRWREGRERTNHTLGATRSLSKALPSAVRSSAIPCATIDPAFFTIHHAATGTPQPRNPLILPANKVSVTGILSLKKDLLRQIKLRMAPRMNRSYDCARTTATN